MNDEDMNNSILASPLAALRGEMAKLDTHRCVEKELMQAFAKQFPPRRRWYQRLDTPQWGIAGSLASIALVVLVFVFAPHAAPDAGGAPVVQRSSDGGVFIALDSFERIEREPAPRMVQAQVPRTALVSLGVPVTPENAGDSVKAEMLVGANGQPLALRLTSLN
jgi:hypothetical protein